MKSVSAPAEGYEMTGNSPEITSSYVCFSSGVFYAYASPFYVFFSFFRLA
jgi:hypothetical protein